MTPDKLRDQLLGLIQAYFSEWNMPLGFRVCSQRFQAACRRSDTSIDELVASLVSQSLVVVKLSASGARYIFPADRYREISEGERLNGLMRAASFRPLGSSKRRSVQ